MDIGLAAFLATCSQSGKTPPDTGLDPMNDRSMLKPRRPGSPGIALLVIVAATLLMAPIRWCSSWAQLATDQAAPPFALEDLEGRRHELSDALGTELVILYFCDLESSSNRNGLHRVNALLESLRDINVKAFAITSSPGERARAFTNETPISFPLLVDTAGVIDQYHSHLILPTVYLLNRELMVSRVVVGGGRSMEIQIERAMETALAGDRKRQPPASQESKETRTPSGKDGSRQLEVVRAPSMPPPPIRKTTEAPEEKARRLFQLAREENLKLKWDECLASKALERARSLHEKGAFEHKDPRSGRNPAFEMVKSCERSAAYAGENLSRGMAMTSRAIHQEFMASSTHRENIQNRRFSKMGVGCYETICVELFMGF